MLHLQWWIIVTMILAGTMGLASTTQIVTDVTVSQDLKGAIVKVGKCSEIHSSFSLLTLETGKIMRNCQILENMTDTYHLRTKLNMLTPGYFCPNYLADVSFFIFCSVSAVDHCYSNPCKNSGTCQNLTDSYRCQCATGFTGANCEGLNLFRMSYWPCWPFVFSLKVLNTKIKISILQIHKPLGIR